jgi:hypothetical protein
MWFWKNDKSELCVVKTLIAYILSTKDENISVVYFLFNIRYHLYNGLRLFKMLPFI